MIIESQWEKVTVEFTGPKPNQSTLKNLLTGGRPEMYEWGAVKWEENKVTLQIRKKIK